MDVRADEAVPVGLWRLAVAAGLASFLDAALLVSVSVSLAIWQSHFRLTSVQLGLLGGGLAFCFAAGSLVGGLLADRLGRQRMFVADLIICLVGLILVFLAPVGHVLVVGTLLAGFGAGADVPTSLAIIAGASPGAARGRMVAVTQSLWIAGVLVTLGVGFATSNLGYQGTRVLIGVLIVVSVVTLALRLTNGRVVVPSPHSRPSALVLRLDVWKPLVTLTAFYLFWNAAATSLGSYGVYYLVRVTGTSQTVATGAALMVFPLALVMSLVFVRLADTPWRDRLSLGAMALQVLAFGLGAATGGTALWGMVGLLVLYSLTNVFGGEAAYKVWLQLLLPEDVRAAATGLSYAVARTIAAGFVLSVPALIVVNPAALLWVLTGCVTISGALGVIVIALLRPNAASR